MTRVSRPSPAAGSSSSFEAVDGGDGAGRDRDLGGGGEHSVNSRGRSGQSRDTGAHSDSPPGLPAIVCLVAIGPHRQVCHGRIARADHEPVIELTDVYWVAPRIGGIDYNVARLVQIGRAHV